MNIFAVMQELQHTVAYGIPGVRELPYSGTPQPPACWASLPETLDYDSTMVRGSDSMTVEVGILVSLADPRSAHEQVAAYADGSGPRSVKRVIEEHKPPSSYDVAVVQSVQFDEVSHSGTPFLAATFSVDITGSGA